MSRFFTEPSNIGDRHIKIVDTDDIKHMRKVLRLKVGDKVEISDASQWEYDCEITSITESEIMLLIQDKQSFAREPSIEITLFQGIPKAGKMELIIQKAVELGVFEIVPVFMARTVVVEKGNFGKKLERWQKVSDEAGKQCRRGRIPKVLKHVSFTEVIEDMKNYDLILFPYENEKKETIKDCLKKIKEKPKRIAIIIGPEGGFADSEAEQLDEIGAERVSLGATILRTETAGMAAIAMTMYELEL